MPWVHAGSCATFSLCQCPTAAVCLCRLLARSDLCRHAMLTGHNCQTWSSVLRSMSPRTLGGAARKLVF